MNAITRYLRNKRHNEKMDFLSEIRMQAVPTEEGEIPEYKIKTPKRLPLMPLGAEWLKAMELPADYFDSFTGRPARDLAIVGE